VSEPREIVVSALAAEQIRAAEEWWRINRPKAPQAIREETSSVRPPSFASNRKSEHALGTWR
jgi:hypothetical protein